MSENGGAIAYENFLYLLDGADRTYSKDSLIEAIKTKYHEELKIEKNALDQDFLLKAKLELAQAVRVLEGRNDHGELLTYSDKLARDLLYNSINNINGTYQRNCIFFRDNAKYKKITQEYNSAIVAIKKYSAKQAEANDIDDNRFSFKEEDDDILNLNQKGLSRQKKEQRRPNNSSNEYDDIINRRYYNEDSCLWEIVDTFKKNIVNIAIDSLCSCTGKTSVMTK